MDIMNWIQSWYKNNCDGHWEHMYGVKIDTIDNPGWSVAIDLLDTSLEEKTFEKISYDVAEDNWLICFVENGVYKGRGSCNKLEEILMLFRKWVEN